MSEKIMIGKPMHGFFQEKNGINYKITVNEEIMKKWQEVNKQGNMVKVLVNDEYTYLTILKIYDVSHISNCEIEGLENTTIIGDKNTFVDAKNIEVYGDDNTIKGKGNKAYGERNELVETEKKTSSGAKDFEITFY